MESSSGTTGAAEEPEPEPDEPLPAAAPSSYDPRIYQPPHPDDRGAAGDGKLTKKGAKSNKAKGTNNRCSNCDAAGAKRKCTRCCVVHYCGKECQAVRSKDRPRRRS